MSGATGSGSYVVRAIDVTIVLGTGTFGATDSNKVKLTGLRVIASIQKAAMPTADQCSIRVYGVPPSIAAQVTTLGIPFGYLRLQNTILIEAGDATNGMAAVYQGQILNAWNDYDSAPETFLNFAGVGALSGNVVPIPPTSINGTADVATLMSGLANQMGYAFENGGVTAKIAYPYLAGTAMQQAQTVARAANVELYMDSGKPPGTLAIWPKTGSRGGAIPLISPGSGLIGYPKYRDRGMAFRCLLNPNIRIGGQIEMQSSSGGAAPPATGATTAQAQAGGANGRWTVSGPLIYELASRVPQGPWWCDVTCWRVLGPQS